jgi:hypothetical protein
MVITSPLPKLPVVNAFHCDNHYASKLYQILQSKKLKCAFTMRPAGRLASVAKANGTFRESPSQSEPPSRVGGLNFLILFIRDKNSFANVFWDNEHRK